MPGAGFRQEEVIHHPRVQAVQRGFVIQAACDAGLVGHHEDVPSRLGGQADRLDGALHPLEPVARPDITVVDVDRAVPVQEQSRAMPPLRQTRNGDGMEVSIL